MEIMSKKYFDNYSMRFNKINSTKYDVDVIFGSYHELF